MRVRDEYKDLVIGSKFGAGVQGSTFLPELWNIVDRLLVLDGDEGAYFTEQTMWDFPDCAHRSFVRIYHTPDGWKDPIKYAEHCSIRMEQLNSRWGIENFLLTNENIAVEGLGESQEDYVWFKNWYMTFLDDIERRMGSRYADMKIWGPAFSPGRGEDGNLPQDPQPLIGYYIMEPVLRRFFGIASHHYWSLNWGYIGHLDAPWYAQRVTRAYQRINNELGIVKPWIISEWNSDHIDIGERSAVEAYIDRCKEWIQWVNSLDYVVATFYFLYCCSDPAHAGYTWTRMRGGLDCLHDGWNKLSEGRWKVPQVGEGYKKAEGLITPWQEDEIYHGTGGNTTSLAIGDEGEATWRKKTNQTVVICDDGRIFADRGNYGDGSLVQLCGPFPPRSS